MKKEMTTKITTALLLTGINNPLLAGPIDKSKDYLKNVLNKAKMQGSFESDCYSSDLFDVSEKISHEFLIGSYTKTISLYSSKDCKDLGAKITLSGDYDLKQKRDNTYYIDTKLDNAEVLVRNAKLQNLMNEFNFCGVSEWQKNKTVNITDKTPKGICKFGKLPRSEYLLGTVKDGNLELGSYGYIGAESKSDRASNTSSKYKFKG